ncbi:type IV pilus modification protein PilV [Parendozoicomonas haliclonae]|nr:type IV pilus modification protein PilV [Parendozoicomonas haliclonae]
MKQSGFNLIENLVTLFILTVGLLGVAGMQAMALKTQQTSHHYDKALALAQNMADRMRANQEAALAGYYSLNTTNVRNYPIEAQAACYTTEGCNPEQMAVNDMYEWHEAVMRTLPSGDSYICQDSTPSEDPSDYIGDPFTVVPASCDNQGDVYVIHVIWDMDKDRDGTVELSSNPEETDGHLMLVFEP